MGRFRKAVQEGAVNLLTTQPHRKVQHCSWALLYSVISAERAQWRRLASTQRVGRMLIGEFPATDSTATAFFRASSGPPLAPSRPTFATPMLYATLVLGFASSVDALRIPNAPRAQVVASKADLGTAWATLGE